MNLIFGRKKPRGFSPIKEANIFSHPNFFNKDYNFQKLNTFFRTFQSYELEIGFGIGENLINQAKLKPRTGFIACDPHLRGHFEVLSFIANSKVKNILLSNLSFEDLRQYLQKNLSNVYILFPDPWPKMKHRKRRLINCLFVMELSKIVKSSGNIFLSSDNMGYVRQIDYCFKSNSDFLLKKKGEFKNIAKTVGLIKTKYYFKAISNGLKPHYVHFIKK